MSIVKIDNAVFTSIANSIRNQNGTEELYYPSEMPDAITALIWQGTQEEYEEIEEPNPSTLYIIIEEEE